MTLDESRKLLQLNGSNQSRLTAANEHDDDLRSGSSATTNVAQVNEKEKCHDESDVELRLVGNSFNDDDDDEDHRVAGRRCVNYPSSAAEETGGHNRPSDQQQVVRSGQEEEESKVKLVNEGTDRSQQIKRMERTVENERIANESSAKSLASCNGRPAAAAAAAASQPRNRSGASPLQLVESGAGFGQLNPVSSDTCQTEQAAMQLLSLSAAKDRAALPEKAAAAAAAVGGKCGDDDDDGPIEAPTTSTVSTNLATNEEEERRAAAAAAPPSDTPNSGGLRCQQQAADEQAKYHHSPVLGLAAIHCRQNSLLKKERSNDSETIVDGVDCGSVIAAGIQQQASHSGEPTGGHEIVVEAIPERLNNSSQSSSSCHNHNRDNQSSFIRVKEVGESCSNGEEDNVRIKMAAATMSPQHSMLSVKDVSTNRNRNVSPNAMHEYVKNDPASSQLAEAARRNDLVKFFNQYKGEYWFCCVFVCRSVCVWSIAISFTCAAEF